MEVFEKVLDAMTYASTMGVVHRDLKPDNILLDLDSNGKVLEVFVADWGEARTIECFKDLDPRQKVIKCTVGRGTIGFAAPEIFREDE